MPQNKLLNINTEIPDELLEKYKENINMWKKPEGKFGIYIFSFSFNSKKELLDNWEQTMEDVALSFQSNIDLNLKDIERWNIYLFFFSIEDVPIECVREIENNKFSSRKIVIDNCKSDLNKDVIRKEIKTKLFDYEIPLSHRSEFQSLDSELKDSFPEFSNLLPLLSRQKKSSADVHNELISKLLKVLKNEN